jgi:hypothetical protein
MRKIAKVFLLTCLAILAIRASDPPDYQHPKGPEDEIVMAVGQIMPGVINTAETNQKIHLLKTGQLERKYLFLQVTTLLPTRLSIGLYSNETKDLIYACENTTFDSCYISAMLLRPDTLYAVLIVSDDNMKYNLYTYWGDLEHIRPNQ